MHNFIHWQWTEIGASGVHGVLAVRLVKKENSLENATVMHQPRSTVERNAKEIPVKAKSVIKMLIVQVRK